VTRRTYILGVAAALLAGLLVAATLALSLPAQKPGLSAARSRWAARPFARYRLVVAQDHNRCRHESEVRGARVARVLSNPCGLPDRSIDDLLALIDAAPTVVYPCVAHGCACETVVGLEGIYSEQFGYPRALGRRWVVRANWRHPDFWRYLRDELALPPCRKDTFITTIDVLAITALPD